MNKENGLTKIEIKANNVAITQYSADALVVHTEQNYPEITRTTAEQSSELVIPTTSKKSLSKRIEDFIAISDVASKLITALKALVPAILFIMGILGWQLKPSSVPTVDTFSIGISRDTNPLTVYQIGNGPNHLLLVGGIHGDEPFSSLVVIELAKHFQAHAELVPSHTTLYFLPILNPDGIAKKQRMTSTGVDLNRNWQTDSWQKDAVQPGCITNPASGGNEPFSEPETAALSTWLLNQKEDADLIRIISYHTHFSAPNSGRVQPGYIEHGIPDDLSDVLAKTLEKFGYTYQSTYQSKCNKDTPTGEFINWAATKGLTIAEIELSSNGIATVAGKQAAIQKALESIIAVVDMLD